MRLIATLGNESHVVTIRTYCHKSKLIATNAVVAIDPIFCSVARDCLVVIECLLIDCFPVFTVLCAPGVTFGDVASVRSTTPSVPTYQRARTMHYL